MKSKLEKEVEKAIGIERKERLLEHFRILEEKTQRKCRITRKHYLYSCPIASFMPSSIIVGRQCYDRGYVTTANVVIYIKHGVNIIEGTEDDSIKFKIYENRDSDWWFSLPYSSQRLVNLWLEEYFRERKKKNKK